MTVALTFPRKAKGSFAMTGVNTGRLQSHFSKRSNLENGRMTTAAELEGRSLPVDDRMAAGTERTPAPPARPSRLPGWLLACLVVCVASGVIFRFTELDRRTYWGDEACTSLRTVGHGAAEMKVRYFHGAEITAADFHQVQKRSDRRGLLDTVFVAAEFDPKHPPLYFVLARLWADVAGDSIVAMRSLPAVFSVLSLPCAYWLAMELFGSAAAAWSMVII